VKKLRKVAAGKRKRDAAAATNALQRKTASMLRHPKECCVCKSIFERTHETVKSWHVVVREERVRLTCPRCWQIIEERINKEQDEKD